MVCGFCRFKTTGIFTATFFQVLLILDLNGVYLSPRVRGEINRYLGPDRRNE
jgi:hypothetical protein